VTVIAAALLLGASVVALARAEATRADYVAELEPICKANTEANKRILKGARAKARHGKLRAAGRQFSRAARAFAQTVKELGAVPRPPADAAVLAKWFGYLRLESAYLGKIATALKAGQGGRAQAYAVRLQRNANLANDTVIGFGFNYCRIHASRFL
jgi:hypothetical protein